MAKVLGYSAYFHDSSACIIVDGKIIAAALEERFTRLKHDSSFPEQAISFCLKKAKIDAIDLDEVVFFEKPFTKFERILETSIQQAPKGFFHFRKAILSWLKTKFWVEDSFKNKFKTNARFSYCQHHFSHASNACFNSPFEEAAYLIVDGVGEKSCTSYGIFEKGKITPFSEQHFPHSIGLLYSSFTQYCGFKVNSGEYKLMGLAPYGEPKFADLIRLNFVTQREDGSIELQLQNFGFLSDLKMINKQFEKVLGQKARNPKDEMTQFYKDVAASIQSVCEELLFFLVNKVQKATQKKNLIFGGGVALNCVANEMLQRNSLFDRMFIHSSSGDGGCAMGAALWRSIELGDLITNKNEEFLGPNFTDSEIEKSLKEIENLNFTRMGEPELMNDIAAQLNDNQVVGWFQGAMEFGPRALGNRSILASPLSPSMKSNLNLKIKKREGFRPFAPIVLNEYFEEYFTSSHADYSRMLYTAQAKNSKKIPACVHIDDSSRVQSLEKVFNPKLFALIESFYQQSGVPILINTSMNERGEPMVCSPQDALSCFFSTEMDVLVLGNYVLRKDANSEVKFKTRTYELD